MGDRGDLIRKFCTVANTSENEAQHLLEAFEWNYEEAIKAHFDDEDASNEVLSDRPDESINQGNSGVLPLLDRQPKLVTFDAIRSDSKTGPDEGQSFYVGGSETGGGGQQVLGPPRKSSLPDPVASPDEFIHKLFQDAKGQGAEVLDPDRYREKTEKRKTRMPFIGVGYSVLLTNKRLGEDPNALSTPEATTSISRTDGPSAVHSSTEPAEEKSIIVKMWREGFSLDNGPLRSYTDPDSRTFLEDIKSGKVPQELIRSANGGLVNVFLEDHHHESWRAPPAPKVVPFSGKGNMLGHPVPKLVSVTPDCQQSTVSSSSPPPGPTVDDSQPVTQLQVRLPDGGRLVIRLNHSHTVQDVRLAIISQRPNLAACPFVLMTTFPSRELSDGSQTIKEANLLNSALLVRLT
ncbi:hypothetical protein CRM22_001374 [Opisthorchis felineus]|uniref:Uncharacterized protein n=1 Tax=Opisthorchis felineus TaxID=147828 RepID=A0A4V6RH75_OPIFE|nr:hypothetical protein CRM22_001374 [Opisthorchis felineus]